MPVEMMFTPGAATSGLRCESLRRGPPELNDARPRKVGLTTPLLLAIDTPDAFAKADPSACSTPKKGIVTPLIGPSSEGYPADVLIMATAAAPWFCPKMARLMRAQTPRSV